MSAPDVLELRPERRVAPMWVPTRDLIVMEVAEAFGVPADLVVSRRMLREAVEARFACVWVADRVTAWSSTQMGRRLFGGRDHTTILHARARAEALHATDREWRRAAERALAMVMEAFDD
ncbi:MAG: helix-turn-helix domain-containing protein [Thermaurantiacus tibetensis]|uniref:helix-turn-helix domain-containing protein n=1 Tax=Thermaurantiacus tibetensis TaxID=2759035 RepID=UPI001F199037|nr:helix-turn-helix domain-containing protein [Thermaurantiacus tibetensis]